MPFALCILGTLSNERIVILAYIAFYARGYLEIVVALNSNEEAHAEKE